MQEETGIKYINIEYFFKEIYDFFKGIGPTASSVFNFFREINFHLISNTLSVIFFIGIVILVIKVSKLSKKDKMPIVKIFSETEFSRTRELRWKEIKARLDSENASSWQMAVISADSLMNEIADKIGYEGESLGEKLKKIEPSDFDNLKNVWEAHQLRNRIVHEGDKFELTKEEAKKAVDKYEKALKELRYI